MGWLAETQLPKEILAALKTTPINEISEPVRSIEGYFLLKPIAVRTINSNDDESTVNLKRFFTKSSAIKKLLNLKNANDACNSPESFSKKLGVSFEDIGVKQIKNLDPQIQPLVSRLETGEFSSPVPYSDGISSYLVCEKVIDTEAKVDDTKRKKAETILYGKKIEMEARKYLRDLRRQTNIEIKLDSIS